MTMKSVDLPHLEASSWPATPAAARTTLAEQCSSAGAIPRLGKVDDGTASISNPRSRSGASR